MAKLTPRDPLRPKMLKDYLGQEHVKELLQIAIQAAKVRNEPLDHVLLNGPPGLGKTTLANIIANEMEWEIKTVVGTGLNPSGMNLLLVRLEPKEMIFIDEVHRLRRATQELLYPVLEDNTIQSIYNSRVQLDLPPLTIIGATTNIGKLERPFIDRFGLQFQLTFYTSQELEQIVHRSSGLLKVQLTDGAVKVVAGRSRGTPRLANTYLRRIRDYADVLGIKEVDEGFAKNILKAKLHVDDIGLKPLDHRYLRILLDEPNGLGIDSMASRLDEEVETLEDFIEPYLLQLGMVERRRNGRWITRKGRKHVLKTPDQWTRLVG